MKWGGNDFTAVTGLPPFFPSASQYLNFFFPPSSLLCLLLLLRVFSLLMIWGKEGNRHSELG